MSVAPKRIRARQSAKTALFACALVFVFLAPRSSAVAQDVTSTVSRLDKNSLGGGLVLARPVSLQTGLSAGVGADYLRAASAGSWFAWGGRASWSTATEYTLTDSVRNDDIRLRLCAVARHVVGRGSFGLRLGMGASTVYEDRIRAQGNRAGLPSGAVEHSSWYLFPGGEVEALVLLRVWNSFGMSLSGGPSLHLIDGAAHAGWATSLGVLWQP